MNRYDHWFWNSNFMNWFAMQLSYFKSWIYHMQFRGKD